MIRRATLDDVDAILAVVNTNTDRLLARDRDEIAQLLDAFWVAEVDGRVVGCCCLEVYSPKIAELRSLAVLPGVPGPRAGRGAHRRGSRGGQAARHPAGAGGDVQPRVLRAAELRAVPEREVRALLAESGNAGGDEAVTAPGLRRIAAGPGAEVTALHYRAAAPARATLVLAHGAGADQRHRTMTALADWHRRAGRGRGDLQLPVHRATPSHAGPQPRARTDVDGRGGRDRRRPACRPSAGYRRQVHGRPHCLDGAGATSRDARPGRACQGWCCWAIRCTRQANPSNYGPRTCRRSACRYGSSTARATPSARARKSNRSSARCRRAWTSTSSSAATTASPSRNPRG